MPRPVILSLSAAMGEIKSGLLHEEHLARAIFCLGCVRNYALQELEKDKRMWKFRTIIERAETEGRVIWKRRDDLTDRDPSWVKAELCKILAINGLNPPDSSLLTALDNQTLKNAIEQANKNGELKVRVIAGTFFPVS